MGTAPGRKNSPVHPPHHYESRFCPPCICRCWHHCHHCQQLSPGSGEGERLQLDSDQKTRGSKRVAETEGTASSLSLIAAHEMHDTVPRPLRRRRRGQEEQVWQRSHCRRHHRRRLRRQRPSTKYFLPCPKGQSPCCRRRLRHDLPGQRFLQRGCWPGGGGRYARQPKRHAP